jgi:predicted aspartyl protease
VLAIALALLAVGVAVAPTATEQGQQALATTSVLRETLPRTLPLGRIAGHLLVDAGFSVADTAVPMFLDTGAPTVVSDQLAERYAGDRLGTVMATGIGGSVSERDVIGLPPLDIGGARFDHVAALQGFVSADNPLSCVSPHGLVGNNVMGTAVWQLDPRAGELTVAATVDGLDHVDEAIRLPFERASKASPSPVVELPAGDGSLRFLVDTGSAGWLSVHPADLERVGLAVTDDAPAVATLAAGMDGTFEARQWWTTLDLQLGDRVLRDVPLAAVDSLAEGQGNMGNDFLGHYVVTIDWIDDALYLDPLVDEPGRPTLPASAGWSWDGTGYVVSSLVEGEPGVAGLALGDRVTALDGEDLSGETRDAFCARYLDERPARFTMTVAGDEPATVEVVPVEDMLAP